MSTDAICTCGHGLGVLRHADDCPVAVERRQPVRLAAAPSEATLDARPRGLFDQTQEVEKAYQRGFGHGRRRAAEDVANLVDRVVAEIGSVRVAYLRAARVALNGPDLSAPSEPVPDGPRVWQTPVIPDDVQAVSDRDGKIWRRQEDEERWWERADHRRVAPESQLIDGRGPLTEVVEATP